jgi:ABC-type branched-subunit amino acid transport system substrate-binding protein
MTALHRIVVLATLVTSGPALAQYTDGVIKIGVLTDMSGVYSELAGPGSVAAARLAVADFGAAAKGMRVEIISGDMQNKPDVGVNIATSWFDVEKVRVVGKVRHPLNTSDFSSFLLQAQASKAKVVGLANGGSDTVNAIKQAAEFGIVKGGQKLAGMFIWISDVAALGLPIAQGLVFTDAWYWDANDENRAWTKRLQVERPGRLPSMAHAGVYSAVTHYLKAVEALKSDADGRAVVDKMKEMKTEDRLFGIGTVRPDGRKIHDMYLREVKKPEESKYPGDFYKTLATIPAAEAFRPLKEGGCPLVDHNLP